MREGIVFAFLQPWSNHSSVACRCWRCLAGLILFLSVSGSGCGGSDPKPGSARANVAQVVPVSVATAERRDMPYYLTGLGSVTAYYTVSVKSRVDGQLMQVNFKEGQDVNRANCWP